jgi:hypothetical protein
MCPLHRPPRKKRVLAPVRVDVDVPEVEIGTGTGTGTETVVVVVAHAAAVEDAVVEAGVPVRDLLELTSPPVAPDLAHVRNANVVRRRRRRVDGTFCLLKAP